MQGNPRRKGHGGEFWQNIHWRRECGKPLHHFCPENPTNSIKRQKDMTLTVWIFQVGSVQYATGEEQRNSSRGDEESEPRQKQSPIVNESGGKSKARCCKEQYCTGTWNVRSINQGKLEVVKQEMARVNINTLGISELKWTGMGEFNSDDHHIYYCGQESFRRNGVTLIVNRRVQNVVLQCNLKNNRMIFLCFQGKSFNIIVIQVYDPTTNAKKLKLNGSVKIFKAF